MSLFQAAGSTIAAGGGALGPSTPPSGGSLTRLTHSDLTYVGAARLPQHQFMPNSLALRYRTPAGVPVSAELATPSDVLHILVVASGGYLIEYKMNTSFSTSTTLAALPTWTETRRWHNWHNYGHIGHDETAYGLPQVVVFPYEFTPGGSPGNGAELSDLHFEIVDGKCVIWYSWTPTYAGGHLTFPNQQCTILDDLEARPAGATSGVDVSSANISGPVFFKSPTLEIWKDATQGTCEIPLARQADFGGKKLFKFGSNTSNINEQGARGIGIWVAGGFPSVASGVPATRSNVLTDAEHIFHCGSGSGTNPYQMWRPPNLTPIGGNIANITMFYVSSSGAYSVIDYNSVQPLSLGVGDCMYFLAPGAADVINVRMITPASGGSYVIEYHAGGGVWAEPADLAIDSGARDMSGTHNVFRFNTVTTVPSTPHASFPADLKPASWWRLRRTVAGSVAGNVYAIYTTTTIAPGYTGLGTDRPVTVGGYIANHLDAVAAYNANPAANHGWCVAEYVDGAVAVRTSVVEGLLFAGKFGTGHRWYGNASLWARETNVSGAAHHYIDSLYGTENGNGNWNEGTIINYMGVFDMDELVEAYAGTRARNNTGLHPKEYWDIRTYTNHPVIQVATSGGPDAGLPLDSQQTFGMGMKYDAVNKRVIYVYSRSGGTDPYTMVWNVRDS